MLHSWWSRLICGVRKEYALVVERPGADDINPENRLDNRCGGRLYSSLQPGEPYTPTEDPRELIYPTFVEA